MKPRKHPHPMNQMPFIRRQRPHLRLMLPIIEQLPVQNKLLPTFPLIQLGIEYTNHFQLEFLIFRRVVGREFHISNHFFRIIVPFHIEIPATRHVSRQFAPGHGANVVHPGREDFGLVSCHVFGASFEEFGFDSFGVDFAARLGEGFDVVLFGFVPEVSSDGVSSFDSRVGGNVGIGPQGVVSFQLFGGKNAIVLLLAGGRRSVIIVVGMTSSPFPVGSNCVDCVYSSSGIRAFSFVGVHIHIGRIFQRQRYKSIWRKDVAISPQKIVQIPFHAPFLSFDSQCRGSRASGARGGRRRGTVASRAITIASSAATDAAAPSAGDVIGDIRPISQPASENRVEETQILLGGPGSGVIAGMMR
mmetsp:Transcript_25487/g.52224  ORF Transcript_25487/g.52224 Transcript_25487/m.52224 type:complete len:359 (-) Transcript_25487:1485-2561(-)